MKRTPLHDQHVNLGGKMVDFAGYALPVQYPTGLMAEHQAVREKAGLFDVSHMGEFLISGPDAMENLNRIMTNDYSKLRIGRMRYTLMCQEDGGTLDDLIVGRVDDDRFLLIVNAANRDSDAEWIQRQLKGQVHFEDLTDDYGLVALQGPRAEAILSKLVKEGTLPEKAYSFKESVRIHEAGDESAYVPDCTISRAGYTGEDGFEIMCRAVDTPALWEILLAAGKDEGLVPCGLGARDSLRLEAGMPLYGQELTTDINPYEADLDFTVKPSEEWPFIGQQAMQESLPVARKRMGLRLTGRGIARTGAEVVKDGQTVGVVTSGTHAPTLGYAVAQAYLDRDLTEAGTEVACIVRNKEISAVVVELPFYKRK